MYNRTGNYSVLLFPGARPTRCCVVFRDGQFFFFDRTRETSLRCELVCSGFREMIWWERVDGGLLSLNYETRFSLSTINLDSRETFFLIHPLYFFSFKIYTKQTKKSLKISKKKKLNQLERLSD